MRKWIGTALFVVMAGIFLIANRGAYRGYFQGDELDSIGWTPQVPLSVYAIDLVSPIYNAHNFRPVGHLYYREMSRLFGLRFPPYVLPLHLLHLLNVWLLWAILRRLGSSAFAAGMGALFFAFQLAVLDVYWKPMYIFEVFCCTFCLVSLLCWIERRFVLSFAAFWLAYKSKELAVMLPVVLACYETWYGTRRWRPLIPFFLTSLILGVQGIVGNPNQDNAYTFHFTPTALAAGARFYAFALFGVPFAGFVLLGLPAIRRERRNWLGIAYAVLFLVPLVFLPGRLFSAYWYVPLAGVAMAFSSLAEMKYGWLTAAFLLLWLPWSYLGLRIYRQRKLADDGETQTYVNQIRASSAALAGIPAYLYQGLPPSLPPWGVAGALRFFLNLEIKLYPMNGGLPPQRFEKPLATLVWEEQPRKLLVGVHRTDTPDAWYLTMNQTTPIWQLEDGWFDLEGGFRWTSPIATARLFRPEGATRFEIVTTVSNDRLGAGGYFDLSARLNGIPLGTERVAGTGIRTIRWEAPPGKEGSVQIELRSDPPFQVRGDPRTLGAAVMALGFLPAK